jgi:predicted RNA polymerase sigma factor
MFRHQTARLVSILVRHLGSRHLGRGIYHLDRAGTAGETDWTRLLAFYDQLMIVQPSPVVWLNRAVARVAPRCGVSVLNRNDAFSECDCRKWNGVPRIERRSAGKQPF